MSSGPKRGLTREQRLDCINDPFGFVVLMVPCKKEGVSGAMVKHKSKALSRRHMW